MIQIPEVGSANLSYFVCYYSFYDLENGVSSEKIATIDLGELHADLAVETNCSNVAGTSYHSPFTSIYFYSILMNGKKIPFERN